MRVFRKSAVFAISILAFMFLTPVSFIRAILKKDAGITLSDLYSDVLMTVEDALKVLLPDAKEIKEDVKVLTEEQKKAIETEAKIKFDPELDKEHYIYSGFSADGKFLGCAMLDTVKGKWGPIQYMMSVDSTGKIVDIIVLSYKERRGRPVAERRFLGQFKGKSLSDKVELKKDVRGVSGATISSRGMTDGIRKLVYIFKYCCKP